MVILKISSLCGNMKNVFFCMVIFLSVNIYSAHAYDESLPQMEKGALGTRDDVDISYERYMTGHDEVIIICPGFYNSKKSKWMKETAKMVSSEYDVIIFDFRGHGESMGKYTWSAREQMDVDAVIEYAKSKDYKRIGILAFSLGASSAINAVAERDDVNSMVLISCPASFETINFNFWEPGMFSDLADNIESKWEGKGARTTHIFLPKKKPVETIAGMKNVPILFVHGGKDWVVKSSHSRKLFDADGGTKELVVIEDGFHAERLIQKYPERMEALIMNWFEKTMK